MKTKLIVCAIGSLLLPARPALWAQDNFGTNISAAIGAGTNLSRPKRHQRTTPEQRANVHG